MVGQVVVILDLKQKPKTPKIDPKSGGGMSGLTGAIEKIDKNYSKVVRLLLVAKSVFVFGKVQEFMKVEWKAIGMAIVAMLALKGN